MIINSLPRRLRRFVTGSDGSISVEAMIVLPILITLFLGTWVWFDVSRQQSMNQKANYTIGDMISRETDPIDDDYIDAAYELLHHLTRSSATESDLRLSVVTTGESKGNGKSKGNKDEYDLVWSVARGAYAPLDDDDIDLMWERLPDLADGDQVILIETWEDYVPDFEAGLDAFEIRTYSFTRPRFAPQVIYLGAEDQKNANNGWGNGDQAAPGNSLCNTNAENADEGAASNECVTNETGAHNNGGGTKNKGNGKG